MHGKGNTATAEPEAPKPKRGGARKLPEDKVLVKFIMDKTEFDTLKKIADADDRDPHDFARLLARRAVKTHNGAN